METATRAGTAHRTTVVDPVNAHRHTSRCVWELHRCAWSCAVVRVPNPGPEGPPGTRVPGSGPG